MLKKKKKSSKETVRSIRLQTHKRFQSTTFKSEGRYDRVEDVVKHDRALVKAAERPRLLSLG